jgi:hypothetical protein
LKQEPALVHVAPGTPFDPPFVNSGRAESLKSLMISEKQRAFRFAPSPNGYLHLGHAYSALLNFDLARQCGGRFLLRIEDIDRGRARPEFEAAGDRVGAAGPAPVRAFPRLRPCARAA